MCFIYVDVINKDSAPFKPFKYSILAFIILFYSILFSSSSAISIIVTNIENELMERACEKKEEVATLL